MWPYIMFLLCLLYNLNKNFINFLNSLLQHLTNIYSILQCIFLAPHLNFLAVHLFISYDEYISLTCLNRMKNLISTYVFIIFMYIFRNNSYTFLYTFSITLNSFESELAWILLKLFSSILVLRTNYLNALSVRCVVVYRSNQRNWL